MSFELADGGRFRVVPGSQLTPEDRAFLRTFHDEAHAVIHYYSHEEHAQ